MADKNHVVRMSVCSHSENDCFALCFYVVTMADPCMQIDEGEVEIPEA